MEECFASIKKDPKEEVKKNEKSVQQLTQHIKANYWKSGSLEK